MKIIVNHDYIDEQNNLFMFKQGFQDNILLRF